MAVMRVVPEVAVEAGAVVWEAVAMAATAVAEEEMAADRAATMAEAVLALTMAAAAMAVRAAAAMLVLVVAGRRRRQWRRRIVEAGRLEVAKDVRRPSERKSGSLGRPASLCPPSIGSRPVPAYPLQSS